MLSPIDTPREILQKILLFSMGDTPAGPPREFASLMLTCRSVYQKLNTPEVYTMVLCQNFDMDKPLRCLGIEVVHHHAKHELQRRFIALNCFRSQNTNDSSLTEALWVAYSMLEESYPGGKNIRQITWAGLTRFLDSYLRQHLYDGSASNNNWPLAGERNSLALALAWIVTPSGWSLSSFEILRVRC
ncbi:hypothetical protein BD779DRAFT_418733 [Infundibulicybe gibba]|nr:hypothetical protein BD779DRAFT_418733 [Infundibulicybe gibba]